MEMGVSCAFGGLVWGEPRGREGTMVEVRTILECGEEGVSYLGSEISADCLTRPQ